MPDRLFIHLACRRSPTRTSRTQWLEKVANASYNAPAVEPDFIAAVRADTAKRQRAWTAAELSGIH